MTNELTSEELIEQGLAALEVAEFDDAIDIFGQAAIEDSTNAGAWFYLGLCYHETGQPDFAIEALNRAIAANTDYADAHYLLGTVIGATGQIDMAAQCYRRALEIDPHHHKAEEFLIRTEALIASREHYRTAVRLIYSEEQEPDWANRAARELLQSAAIFNDSPAKAEFARLAGKIIESGSIKPMNDLTTSEGPFWTSAVRHASHYNEALDLSPDHAFIHHALGLIYFALGDAESGLSAWQRVPSIDPDYDFSARGQIDR
jgi:tetratricopeptide (TPR) repeat protein